MFDIQKAAPMPLAGSRSGITEWLRKLDVGDCLNIDASATNKNRISTTCAKLTKRTGRKFSQRRVGEKFSIWRVA